MKKLILIILAALAASLGACDNQVGNAYDQAMKQGREAMQLRQYSKAEDYFVQAQKVKKGDRTSAKLLAQLKNLAQGRRALKNNQWTEAELAFNRVIIQKGGSGTLIKQARDLKNKTESARYPSGTVQSAGTDTDGSASTPASTSSSSSVTTDKGTTVNADSSANSSAQETSSASSAPSSSSENSTQQQKAETAVAEAAGYAPDKVYFETTDNGSYYAIELRENHSGDSAADPDTAPTIGFFRYYKADGRIAQLDIVTNKYKEIK
ncbi:MAG: hypothetical protein ABF651_07860 [Sporolactobacillus sp.]